MHPNTDYVRRLRAKYKAEGRCYCGRQRDDPTKKWCLRCRERSKLLSAAQVVRFRAWAKANPEAARAKARKDGLRQRHGLSVEEYERIFATQGAGCAICGSKESRSCSGHFHVDHDHATGRVRGILCQPCNTALGQLCESETILFACIEYLRKHRLKAI